MTVDQAQSLIEKLGALNLNSPSEDNAKTHSEALRLSKELVLSLQKSESVAIELAYATFIPMSARIAVDLKLFEYIVDNGRPITVGELATLSGAEELFIIGTCFDNLRERILRPLAGAGFVKEVDEEVWVATPISEAMTKPGVAAGHRMLFEMLSGAAVKAPK
ncbi:hypothetical protein BOTCAL_0088g00030 [Botryotinia calthae]|uniref:O-methyltransferase dimerisation domain-containing protein n=1 Tax=Botryotinia calthae TaxID=38488 RepID=A0A4Y8D9R1_9HELO|nr:hypothetical protein BOTCAL_0088g00030 [Botryotinia calthae]